MVGFCLLFYVFIRNDIQKIPKLSNKYVIYCFYFSVSVKNNHPYPDTQTKGFSIVFSTPPHQKNMYFLALWYCDII